MDDGSFSIDAYPGADPTGASFSDAALSAAVAAATAAGAPIFVPPGRFKLSQLLSLTLPPGCPAFYLRGAGRQIAQLYWPAAGGGIALTMPGSTQSFHVEEISLVTGAGSGGTGLSVTNSSGAMDGTEPSALDNVTLEGASGGYWTTGVSTASVSFVNSRALTVLGINGAPVGTGVRIAGSAAAPAIVFNFDDASLEYLKDGIVVGDWVQGIAALKCNFSGVNGIVVPAGLAGLIQMTVSNSQFGPYFGTAIGTESAFADAILRDNLFLSSSGGNGVILDAAQRGSICGNHFVSLNGGGTALRIGPPGNPAIGGLVSDNVVNGYAVGIDLAAGSSGWQVQGNLDLGNAQFLRNAGSGNLIAGESFAASVSASVPMSSGAPATVVSLDLPAGTFLVTGSASFDGTPTTDVSAIGASISLTPGVWGEGSLFPSSSTGFNANLPAGQRLITLASPGTVYLVVYSSFTGGTNGAWGGLAATRLPTPGR